MERKDIKVGTRVQLSSRGLDVFGEKLDYPTAPGTVDRLGRNFITVEWDSGQRSTTLKPWHLDPE